jgi:glycosyltransferase involved in cell wall biosynthesis
VGGIVDAVVDGDTGFLVAPRDPTALAAAIERLLIDPERRRELGKAAARRARAQFHVNYVLPSLESLYDRLLSASAR